MYMEFKISNKTRLEHRQLSQLLRKVYGINTKANVSFSKHGGFIVDVLKDFSNISYNLAIADYVPSEEEKNFMLQVIKVIFFPTGNNNGKILETIKKQILSFETNNPEIDSPIYVIEKAKGFDKINKTKHADEIRDLIVSYAETLTLVDGFESVREFEVLETFKLWIND